MPRLTCPRCDTSYTDTRCGVDLDALAHTHGSAMISCLVCQTGFTVTPREVISAPRVVTSRWLRQKSLIPGERSLHITTVLHE